jgi:RNA polymerase sigma factor (sigma-70 family)
MASSTSPALRRLRRAALGSQGGSLSDGQLLRAFLDDHDECAFEALVRRHGPMVMGVCRRVLHHAHDAEDAFQATFLVLVRKAGSLACREIIGDWLHGVALRTALKARSAQGRRRGKERQMARPEAVAADLAPEWHALLDQELQGLPEKYRVPIILCELEGRTHQEAARQLGCPIGTLSGRLSRARSLLARRLTRRGLSLSAGGLAGLLCSDATAAGVNQVLVSSTVKAAAQIAEGQAAAGIVSSQVAALTEGVVKAMLMSKLKTLGAISALVVMLGLGAGSLRHAEAADGEVGKASREQVPAPPARLPPAAATRDREFQISLQVTEIKDGKSKQIALPRLTTTNGKEGSFTVGGEIAKNINNKVQLITTGLTVRALVTADAAENPELDMTVTLTSPQIEQANNKAVVTSESVRLIQGISFKKPASVELKPKEKNAPSIHVTATVTEVLIENPLAAAERDLKTAEFYLKSGQHDSAHFVYDLILRRYPDTLYAKQAKEQIAALKKDLRIWPPEKKEPDQIDELLIINNTNAKIEESAILEKLRMKPGQPLTTQRLQEALTRLLRSGLFENPPKIRISWEGDQGAPRKVIVTIDE